MTQSQLSLNYQCPESYSTVASTSEACLAFVWNRRSSIDSCRSHGASVLVSSCPGSIHILAQWPAPRGAVASREADQRFDAGRELPVASGRTRDLKGAEVAYDNVTQNGSQGTEVQLLEGFKQHSFGRGDDLGICLAHCQRFPVTVSESELHEMSAGLAVPSLSPMHYGLVSSRQG